MGRAISTRRAALALALAIASAFATPGLARASDVRDAALVDQFGARFTLRDLAGAPSAIAFVASRCGDACPIVDAEFSLLHARLRREGRPARLVTITLDPTYDTPFVFAKLARANRAPSDGTWRFASGSPEIVRRVMRSFGVTTHSGPGGVPDVHDTFVYVLDRNARLATTFLLSTTVAAAADAAMQTLRLQAESARAKPPSVARSAHRRSERPGHPMLELSIERREKLFGR